MNRKEAIDYLDAYLVLLKITAGATKDIAKDIVMKTFEAISILLNEIKENDKKLEKYGMNR